MYVPLSSRGVAELLTQSEVHDAITNRGGSGIAMSIAKGDLIEQPEANLDDILAGDTLVIETIDKLVRGKHERESRRSEPIDAAACCG